ncbi:MULTISPECIES: MFS transporter [Thalassospira]|jgi:predicted MFS family arabinose efflux permease|uniref:MFS transporter n=1 Tax=Thalassospira TaxID=168934 RepID=UPI000DEDE7C0|nr:MFS transporter [Thalassospira xiamenensis]RCK40055.1 MFS transporter [Thalassospira xiamenensis]
MSPTLRTARWFPWLVLVAGCLVLAVNLGIRPSLGLFIPDMLTVTGWSASTFGLAFAIQNLMWGVAAPIAGALADRYGTTRTLIGGALFYALGLYLMGISTSPMELHLTSGFLIGAGVGATSFPVILAAISRAFPPNKRSFALGLASAGGSVGQFVMAPTTQFLNDGYGYVTALAILAVMSMIIVPFAFALTGKAEAHGPNSGGADLGPTGLVAAFHEARKHRGFLLLNAGFFVCGFHIAVIATHLPTFTQLCGLPGSVAAKGLAIVGLFNIVGTLTAGWVGGKWRKKWSLSFIYGMRALVILLFMLAPKTAETIWLFSALMGALWLSTVPLTSGIIVQVFGPRYMATLFGIVMLSHQIGAFFGAWMGGIIFDMTGSFDGVWITSIALGIFAAIVHMPIDDKALRVEANA